MNVELNIFRRQKCYNQLSWIEEGRSWSQKPSSLTRSVPYLHCNFNLQHFVCKISEWHATHNAGSPSQFWITVSVWEVRSWLFWGQLSIMGHHHCASSVFLVRGDILFLHYCRLHFLNWIEGDLRRLEVMLTSCDILSSTASPGV